MAAHEGTSFDKEQMEVLASVVKCLAGNIEQQWGEVETVFKLAEGGEVIAKDTPYIEPIEETCKITRDAFTHVREKLTEISDRIEVIAEQYHIAINANIKKSQEAVAAIQKQAAKAKEATGLNA